MNGIRSQAAALPGASTNLERSAAAYRAGDTTRGERLFRDAFLDVVPLVRLVVHNHLDGAEDREDAIQLAMTNIWRAVETGVVPAISIYAFGASIDRYRREDKHERRRRRDRDDEYTEGAHNSEEREAYWEADPSPAPDHVDESVARLGVFRSVEALAAMRPLWGQIALCLANGLTQAETARALNRPRGTITRNVVEIRRHLEAQAAA